MVLSGLPQVRLQLIDSCGRPCQKAWLGQASTTISDLGDLTYYGWLGFPLSLSPHCFTRLTSLQHGDHRVVGLCTWQLASSTLSILRCPCGWYKASRSLPNTTWKLYATTAGLVKSQEIETTGRYEYQIRLRLIFKASVLLVEKAKQDKPWVLGEHTASYRCFVKFPWLLPLITKWVMFLIGNITSHSRVKVIMRDIVRRIHKKQDNSTVQEESF